MLDTNKCIALNPSNSPAQQWPAFPARPWFNVLSPVSTTSFFYLSTSRLNPSSCPFLNWDSQSPQCLTPLSLHFILCFRNPSFSCTCRACPFQRRLLVFRGSAREDQDHWPLYGRCHSCPSVPECCPPLRDKYPGFLIHHFLILAYIRALS